MIIELDKDLYKIMVHSTILALGRLTIASPTLKTVLLPIVEEDLHDLLRKSFATPTEAADLFDQLLVQMKEAA